MLHFLQTYDLTGFDVGIPPDTVGLANQKLAGLRNVERVGCTTSWREQSFPGASTFRETINWRQNEAPVASKALYQSYVVDAPSPVPGRRAARRALCPEAPEGHTEDEARSEGLRGSTFLG